MLVCASSFLSFLIWGQNETSWLTPDVPVVAERLTLSTTPSSSNCELK